MFVVIGFLVSLVLLSVLPRGVVVASRRGGVARGVRRVARTGRMPSSVRGVRSLARGV